MLPPLQQGTELRRCTGRRRGVPRLAGVLRCPLAVEPEHSPRNEVLPQDEQPPVNLRPAPGRGRRVRRRVLHRPQRRRRATDLQHLRTWALARRPPAPGHSGLALDLRLRPQALVRFGRQAVPRPRRERGSLEPPAQDALAQEQRFRKRPADRPPSARARAGLEVAVLRPQLGHLQPGRPRPWVLPLLHAYAVREALELCHEVLQGQSAQFLATPLLGRPRRRLLRWRYLPPQRPRCLGRPHNPCRSSGGCSRRPRRRCAKSVPSKLR